MYDEVMLPSWRPMDPNDLIRQGHAIAQLVSNDSPMRRARRTVLALGSATVLVATVGAGAAYFAYAPATEHSSVYCYTAAGTDAKDLGTETNYRAEDQDAVAVCAALWAGGVLQLGADLPTPPSRLGPLPTSQPVPPLVACVLHGEAAVFPGDAGTCQKLGLPTLQK
jgi:hypothetical protein